jgi:hypothetical protein
MFSFFTLLDTYYFLSLAIFGFPVIIYAVIETARQDSLKKIYDLRSGFQSLLFVCDKIAPKDRTELLFL